MFHVAAHRFEQPNIVDFLPDTEIAQANGLLQGMWRAGLYGIELSKVQHAWSEMAEGYAYYFSIEVLGRFDGNLYLGEREKHRRRWQNLIAYQFFKALDTHIPNNEDNLGRLAYLFPPRNFDEMNNPKVYIDRVNRETRQM